MEAAAAAAPADIGQNVISNIFSVPTLCKNIRDLSKLAVDSMDPASLNKMVEEVTKVAGQVPIVGVGVASVTLIINLIATAEDNKERRQEIERHARFLLDHLPALGELKEVQEELNKDILLLCKEACVLEYESKKRRRGVSRLSACLKNVATAKFEASTLQNVADGLTSLHASFDTLLKVRTLSLTPKYSLLQAGDSLDQDYVAIESRMNEVLSFLDLQPRAIHVVGIYGLGGIGKTTLLRAVRQELINEKKVDAIAYVEMGQDASNIIPALQQDIMLQLFAQNIKFRDDAEGRTVLLNYIQKYGSRTANTLCLILDNVWKHEHLERLLPANLRTHLPPSSILLMSCRPKQHAERFCQWICGAGDDKSCLHKLYEPPLLSEGESEKLFMLKAVAGGQVFNRGRESELVKKIVPLCGGLPLALKVYGSYFNDRKRRTEETWKKVENMLKAAEDSPASDEEKVFERLRVSLELLQPPNLQRAFVDAALFWRGMPWEDAEAALTYSNLLHLEEQSLVAQDDLRNTVKVHDLMVTLAKKYAEKQQASQYLVNSNYNLGGDSIQMDQLRGVSYVDKDVKVAHLAKMSNLSFLVLDNCRIHASLMQRTYLLNKFLPPTTHKWLLLLLLLLFLIVSTIIVTATFFQDFPYTPIFGIMVLGLTFLLLYLFSSRASTPTFLCRDLTFLTLKDCVNTIILAGSLVKLSNLRSLNLSHNHGITHLPRNIFSNLISLHILNLSHWDDLRKLPFLGNMKSLKSLNVSSCTQLQELHKSLGELRKLEMLDVSKCHRLASLPDTLGELRELKVLKATDCDSLDRLPKTIGKLTSLQCLDLSRSDQLTRLPATIGGLVSLQVLDMSRCSGLRELPESLGDLQSLNKLILSHCEGLVQLPASIGKLAASLKFLDLSYCNELKELPTSFQYFIALEILDITYCQKLHAWPNLSSSLPHPSATTEVRGLPRSSTS